MNKPKIRFNSEPLVSGERDREKLLFLNKFNELQELNNQLVTENQRLRNELNKSRNCRRFFSPVYETRKQQLLALLEQKEQLTVSEVKAALKLKSKNYVLHIMKEVAEEQGFVFIKGLPGQESEIVKAKLEGNNKVMWAYHETYKEIMSREIGSTMRVSSIAQKFSLSNQELQSVIGKLMQHGELLLTNYERRGNCFVPVSTRRIKRVR